MTTLPVSQRGRAVLTRIGKQATPDAVAAAWMPARFYDFNAGMDRPKVKDDQLGVATQNTRDATARRQGLPGGSLSRTVPLNLNEIGWWLASGFAVSTTGADGDFVHTFTSAGDPTHVLSLLQKWSTGDWSWDIGAALSSINLTAAKTEGTARAKLGLIGLREAEDTSAPSGTVAAAYAAEDFSDWRWQCLVDDVLVGDATNVDFTSDAGVERVQGLSGDEWPTQHHFGERDHMAGFRLYGAGKVIRDLGRSTDIVKSTLKATHPEAPSTRYLTIDMEGSQFDQAQRGISGAGQFSAEMTCHGSQDSDTAALTIILANGVASYA